MEEELAAVETGGLAGAFLVLADLIEDARAAGIAFGPGRGSLPDSLLSWALGITTPDPVALDLAWERFFAGPGRGSQVLFDVGTNGVDACLDLLARRHGADRVARPLSGEGGERSTSRVVVADRPLAEIVPACLAERTGSLEVRDRNLGDFGLWSLDLLARPELDHLAAVEARIQAAGASYDPNAAPFDEPAVIRLLCDGSVPLPSPFDEHPFRRFLTDCDPRGFTDVVAAWSLWRPGPLESGRADAFVRRRRGQEAADPPAPCLGTFLRETCGIPLYQEQFVRIGRKIAGFDPDAAVRLYRELGKRNPAEIQRLRASFVTGAIGRGVPEAEARAAFAGLEPIAPFLFCKGHAVCEVLLAWRLARAATFARAGQR